jgi:uncharacterized peroxidase-related enzyme
MADPDARVWASPACDLFVPVLTFVFGEAQLDGNCAVVSTARLDEEFYGLPARSDLLRERLVKEASHELGHTFGLRHCADWRCVMASSHAVERLDVKGADFCAACRDRPMPHIELPEGLPGISSAFAFRPETAKPLRALAEALLRGPSPLTSGEREMIAAFVSTRNDCYFCQISHRAAAAHHLGGNYELVDAVRFNYPDAPVSPKLKALLAIAAKVQQGGKNVTSEDIGKARAEGATDLEIHDTVLIAAAFCMYNRYVDGLATVAPTDPKSYGWSSSGGLRIPSAAAGRWRIEFVRRTLRTFGVS